MCLDIEGNNFEFSDRRGGVVVEPSPRMRSGFDLR